MVQTRHKHMAAWSLALLLAAAGAHGAEAKADRDKDGEGSDETQAIEGTWIASVTPPFGAQPFAAYPSYIKGGVFINSPDRLPPSLGTVLGSAQGSWRAVGHGQFVATQIEFRYGPNGDVIGTAKVRSIVRITSKDRFEGHGQLQLCDAMLENCSPPAPESAFATIKGQRLQAEAPVLP